MYVVVMGKLIKKNQKYLLVFKISNYKYFFFSLEMSKIDKQLNMMVVKVKLNSHLNRLVNLGVKG